MQPVNSRHVSLVRLAAELNLQLSKNGSELVDLRSVVGWYMSYGYSHGLSKPELLSNLNSRQNLLSIAESLSDEEISLGKSVPEFVVGEQVEVIVNAKNITYHKGFVRDMHWHHKDSRWLFFIEADGKNISKRYEASDLRLVGA